MRKVLFTLIAISTILLQGCWVTEKGEKIGNIVKLGKQGMLIKTNEAELIRGGLNGGNGSFGKPFDFTIEDDSKLEILQKSLDNQIPVKVKYHKEFASLGRSETVDNSFLDDVEILNK